MSRPDGGPAFPVEITLDGEGKIQGRQTGPTSGFHGWMTLRDYFAAHWRPSERDVAYVTERTPEHYYQRMAEMAYAHADAMLKARQL